MEWDPLTTVRNALWLGGGQWAGKSTVARILAARHGVTAYHYDYHDARGHDDRRIAAQVRRGLAPVEPDWEAVWLRTTPREMAEQVLAGFPERFEWALDDLRALVSPVPIVAEGWGLRPELVAAVSAPHRMVVLVPSDAFRLEQAARLPRAARVGHRVSDPGRAQRNRLERDRLVAEDAVRQARRLGVRVIEVDGSAGVEATADLVAAHFRDFLPRPLATGD
jgi:2-phosphoglycerate kinase